MPARPDHACAPAVEPLAASSGWDATAASVQPKSDSQSPSGGITLAPAPGCAGHNAGPKKPQGVDMRKTNSLRWQLATVLLAIVSSYAWAQPKQAVTSTLI